MKKLFITKEIRSFLSVITCLLFLQTVTGQNLGLQNLIITTTGTGKTTGDVVAMTIYNPTDKEVKESFGPYYIPSSGGYQPYITLVAAVTVPPGKTVTINLQGFCADITKPPVGEKENFDPIKTWIKADQNITTPIPPFKTTINPDTNPEQAAPYLLKAIEEINKSYDKLKSEGKITTPFAGNPEKEREAVIQQTFWIYTSYLMQKPYTKEQFSTRTYEQYEEKTTITPNTLSTDKKQQLDKGIDDFWNTFQAVGTEAKVLNTPSKPEDEKIITPISGPEVTPCECGECRLSEGQGIGIYLEKYGEPFMGDSIPWSTNQIFIDRPYIFSTCKPMNCLPRVEVEMKTTINYKDNKWQAPPAVWKKYVFTTESLVMEHQGEMLIEFLYKCFCGEKQCSEGTTSRKLYFIERNNCCDSIRLKNGGLLKFNFNSGNAVITGNKLTISITGAKPEVFDFSFNLEAIFCNLNTDQVFSELVKLMSSQTKSGEAPIEFSSVKSTGMGGPSTDPNMQNYYGFSFSKRVNEKEISINFSMDKKTCSYDVSVLFNGKLYEYAAPPYLSASQLQSMTYALNNPGQQQYWVNALMILSHLARAQDHKMDNKYQQALYTILGAISTQAANMATNGKYSGMNKQLSELAVAAQQAISSGSFNNIGNVMQKIMPVVNFLGK